MAALYDFVGSIGMAKWGYSHIGGSCAPVATLKPPYCSALSVIAANRAVGVTIKYDILFERFCPAMNASSVKYDFMRTSRYELHDKTLYSVVVDFKWDVKYRMLSLRGFRNVLFYAATRQLTLWVFLRFCPSGKKRWTVDLIGSSFSRTIVRIFNIFQLVMVGFLKQPVVSSRFHCH